MTPQLIKTKTIKANYATLPVIDLSLRFLVQQLEPVAQVPVEMVFVWSSVQKTDPRELIKAQLLKEWHKHFKGAKRQLKDTEEAWVFDVDSVELIECDLLVPKA